MDDQSKDIWKIQCKNNWKGTMYYYVGKNKVKLSWEVQRKIYLRSKLKYLNLGWVTWCRQYSCSNRKIGHEAVMARADYLRDGPSFPIEQKKAR